MTEQAFQLQRAKYALQFYIHSRNMSKPMVYWHDSSRGRGVRRYLTGSNWYEHDRLWLGSSLILELDVNDIHKSNIISFIKWFILRTAIMW